MQVFNGYIRLQTYIQALRMHMPYHCCRLSLLSLQPQLLIRPIRAGLSLLGESHTGAPLVHLVLDPLPETNGKTETQVIQQIADTARELGVLVGVHRTSPLDRWQQRPSLRCVPRSPYACTL